MTISGEKSSADVGRFTAGTLPKISCVNGTFKVLAGKLDIYWYSRARTYVTYDETFIP